MYGLILAGPFRSINTYIGFVLSLSYLYNRINISLV